jgi:hypothetical protein
MSPALVISRREIRTYFNSPVAYIVVPAFTIITGVPRAGADDEAARGRKGERHTGAADHDAGA